MKTRIRWLPWAFLVLVALPAAGIGWDIAVRKNFGTVVPGRIYRSGQPGEAQLEAWIKRYGLRGILTLRHGVPDYEKELAERYGVEIFHVPFSATRGLDEGQWRKIRSVLTNEDNLPLLVHCHGGGDRSGIVAALYRIEVQGWPLEEALQEMNRYYHITLRYPVLRRQLEARARRAPEPAGLPAAP